MIPACIYRGGTSKGVLFLLDDVKRRFDNLADFKSFLPKYFGCDFYGTQINGIGGATSLTNKAAIVWAEGEVLKYKFYQLDNSSNEVADNISCGNIISSVIPFALHKKLITVRKDLTAIKKTIHDINTDKYISAIVEVSQGKYLNHGTYKIPGVESSYPKIELIYQDVYGSILHEDPFILNSFVKYKNKSIHYSVIDGSTLLVIIKFDFTSVDNSEIVKIANIIRQNTLENILKDNKHNRFDYKVLPKIIFFKNLHIEYNNVYLETLYLTPNTIHSSLAISGGVTFVLSSFIKESISYIKNIKMEPHTKLNFNFQTPSGTILFNAELSGNRLSSVSVIRTAKLIFDGVIYD